MSEAAFRAAGQALSALWQEAPINHVDVDGIELNWPGEPTRNQPCEQIKMENNLGLAGIAAQDRYRFGWVPGHEFIDSWQLSECQLEDFGLVHELVAEVDVCDVDVLYCSWCRALEFVNDPTIWSAIELVAETLEQQWPSATEVEKVAADAFWNSVVIAREMEHQKPPRV